LGGNHPGIIAGNWERLEVLGNAIFLRFPNEKLEKPTLAKIFCGSATGHHFEQQRNEETKRTN
jgi:hypothetical protein